MIVMKGQNAFSMKKVMLFCVVFLVFSTVLYAQSDELKNSYRKNNDKNESEQTELLFEAIKNNDIIKTELCIKKGANINAKKEIAEIYWTPLAYAIDLGNAKIVTLLIKSGADVNMTVETVTGDYQIQPIHVVVQEKTLTQDIESWTNYQGYDRAEVLDLLIKSGADVNARDTDDYTPLIYLMQNLNLPEDLGKKKDWVKVRCADMLIQAGADVNARNDEGFTPLMFATVYTATLEYIEPIEKECVDLLIKAGADLNAKNNNGQTALMRALRPNYKRLKMAELLRRAGATE